VILCSGKLYYELLERRRDENIEDVVIVRLEQLYPFPEAELARVIAPYKELADVVWCQEEPMNQGAWYCSQHHMRHVIFKHDDRLYLNYVGRDGSAAAAAGYMSLHLEQQEKLIHEALFGS
jgi:2-oxoglutarate dehydrogenase E1 component